MLETPLFRRVEFGAQTTRSAEYKRESEIFFDWNCIKRSIVHLPLFGLIKELLPNSDVGPAQ